jgi:hypothetical protein
MTGTILFWSVYIIAAAAYLIHLKIAISPGNRWDGQRIKWYDWLIAFIPMVNVGANINSWLFCNPWRQP